MNAERAAERREILAPVHGERFTGESGVSRNELRRILHEQNPRLAGAARFIENARDVRPHETGP